MPINTIIVDDEKPARDELAFLLKSVQEVNVIGQGKNGVEALALIKEHSPDLVFLDVQMPGLDGFGVLKKLVERKIKMPHVVFATAFDQYAVQAFEVNAVDYVLKPFDKSRIAKAIQRARKMMDTQTTATDRLEQLVSQLASAKQNPPSPAVKVLITTQQKLLLVNAEDLIFASIDGGMITVVARDLEGSSNYRTLEEMEEALASDIFWRPHRSHLVNIHHIKEVIPWFKSTFMLKMGRQEANASPGQPLANQTPPRTLQGVMGDRRPNFPLRCFLIPALNRSRDASDSAPEVLQCTERRSNTRKSRAGRGWSYFYRCSTA